MKNADRVARMLGHSYAHVQHALDKGIAWGLGRMRAVSKPEKVVETEGSELKVKAARAAKNTVHFIGEVGTSYFEKYEELKRRK